MKNIHPDALDREEGIENDDMLLEWLENQSEKELVQLRRAIPIKAKLLPNGDLKIVRVHLQDSLLEVMKKIAEAFQVNLLPPDSNEPFDHLYCYNRQGGQVGPLSDLSQPLWRVILKCRCRRIFGLELLLSIKVNTQWKVAPKPSMTPKEILSLYDMDYTQYTLYRPDSADPLPLDMPIELSRGECFEALKDGRYGGEGL